MNDWIHQRSIMMNVLFDEGFRPAVDDDGDIRFKYEGGTFYIVDTKDESYLQLLFLNFWQLGTEDEVRTALLAAARATRETKVAKVWPNVDMTWMSASAEIFCTDWSHVTGATLLRCIRGISTAVETFSEEFKARR